MSPENAYGPLVDDTDVHNAIVAFLKHWFMGYLHELGRRRDITILPVMEPDYLNAKSFAKFPEDRIPACVVYVPSVAEITKEGDGSYRATFPVGVGFVVSSGHSQDDTRTLLSTYLSAAVLAFVQHKSLKSPLYPDGFATDIDWVNTDFGELPEQDSKTIQAGSISLSIYVDQVANSDCGLTTPPSDPAVDPGNYGQVLTADVDIEALD